MQTPSVVSRVLSWAFPGSNKPAVQVQYPKEGDSPEKGPGGGKSVAEQIEPNVEQKSFGMLVDEMNCDYQIKFANFVLAANVAAVQVSISVENGDGPKSDAIQKALQKLWEQTVPAMIQAVGFGRVAFEKDWDYVTKSGVGITVIKRLEPMEYHDSRLRLSEDHKFDGFDVRVSANPDKWLPVESVNAWWLAINATAKNPHGVSWYRGAVEDAWRTKKKTMRNRDIFVRRFAIRGGVAHGPETLTDERTGQIIDCQAKMVEAADNLYSGGTTYLPNTPHSDPDMRAAGKYEWDFAEANAATLDPGPILAVEDKDNVAILRAFGIPEKAAIEGDGVGSFSQLSLQILTLFAVVDSIVAQFIDSFNAYCVQATREANYGEGPGPEFEAHAVKLTNRPDSFVVQLVTSLASNPQFATIMLSGGVDLRGLLESLGLPVSPQLEELAKQVAGRFMATVGPVAGAPGQGPGLDAGVAISGDPVPAEFANFSTLQLNRVFAATSKIQNALIDGTDSETVARIKLKAIGWAQDNVDKLIGDASDGTIDVPTPAPVAMANLLHSQKQQFQTFLDDLVKKKSLKP